MHWNQIEGRWKRFTGSARERWGKLTDDDFQTAAGHKENLVGRIQERHGITKEEAEKQANEWSAALKDSAREVGGTQIHVVIMARRLRSAYGRRARSR